MNYDKLERKVRKYNEKKLYTNKTRKKQSDRLNKLYEFVKINSAHLPEWSDNCPNVILRYIVLKVKKEYLKVELQRRLVIKQTISPAYLSELAHLGMKIGDQKLNDEVQKQIKLYLNPYFELKIDNKIKSAK